MDDTPGRNEKNRDESELEALIQTAREAYHPPPETPREDIWAAIQERLPVAPTGTVTERAPDGAQGTGQEAGAGAGADAGHRPTVTDLGAARRRRIFRLGGPVSWAAAAGIVLLMGIGIGRTTAPGTAPAGSVENSRTASTDPAPAPVANATTSRKGPANTALHAAALQHLGQTESLLTMVRTEGRSGSLDPQVGAWARTLLVQTRFLMDAQGDDTDPAVGKLMEDLELVLAQIVGVTESETTDQSRAKAELDLALSGLDEKEVLTRIQAVS